MRITKFEGYIFWLVIFIGTFLFGILTNYFISTIVLIPSVLFFIFWTMILSDDLRTICVFKYKVIEVNKYGRAIFEVKALVSWWLFIPYWEPMDEDIHTYDSQNIFGADTVEFYKTEVTYNSNSDALKAIEKHKKWVERKRNDFFSRPEKNKTKVTYY